MGQVSAQSALLVLNAHHNEGRIETDLYPHLRHLECGRFGCSLEAMLSGTKLELFLKNRFKLLGSSTSMRVVSYRATYR